MKFLRSLTISLWSFCWAMGQTAPNKMLENFLAQHDIRYSIFCVCESSLRVQRDLLIGLQHSRVWTSIYNIDNTFVFNGWYQHPGMAVILHADCPQASKVFRELIANHRLESLHWLLVASNMRNASDLLTTQSLTIDSMLTVAIASGDFYDVYNPSFERKGELQVTYLGSWSPLLGFELLAKRKKMQRSLNGIQLRVATTANHVQSNESLETYLYSGRDKFFDPTPRFSLALLDFAMRKFNFSISLRRTKVFGALLSDGKWSGVVGFVHRKEVDLGITPLQVTDKRLDACDYVTITWSARVCFIFRHPKNFNFRILFLQPFENSLWLSVLACVAIMSIAIWALISQRDAAFRESSALFIVVGILCQQSNVFQHEIRRASGQVLILSLFFFSIILYQFYSTFLISSLLLDQPKSMTTLEHLLMSKLQVGIENLAYNKEWFSKTEITVAKRLYEEKILARNHSLDIDDGLKRVKKGNFAFYTESAVGYKVLRDILTDEEKCELQEIFFYPPLPIGSIVQKRSPFKDLISFNFQMQKENGIHSYLYKIWHSSKPACVKSNTKVSQLYFGEFSPILVLLLFGICIASLIFTVELFIIKKIWPSCL